MENNTHPNHNESNTRQSSAAHFVLLGIGRKSSAAQPKGFRLDHHPIALDCDQLEQRASDCRRGPDIALSQQVEDALPFALREPLVALCHDA
ncbi:hypothetical protein PHSY_004001 [Pseudozyma hubeiensis SY62]|uniref:Uncharacterized protein n=1 Tax=Pseudozyma hubeiensis (strain SY62) TaxID=1305764 RepID=R9P4Z2_PSEHS|nr:hypothetical protein PHSY_004001 [Pseudozyma hubeiensis SY62]GAC96421.1 hypothetical protein PHSY_004001 [Pseudozyma hubeiensis SY62]